MSTKNEFGEVQRKNMEAAMRLAQLSIENSQKIMALQSQLARDLLADSLTQAKAQATKADPMELMNQRTRQVQENMQKMVAVAREIAEIGNHTRTEFSRLMTEQLAAGSQEMVDALQSFFSTLPGQNTNVLEAMQQAMSNANTAFAQMTKASAEIFENIKATAHSRRR